MYSRPVWAEIDLTALAHNVRQIRSLTAPKAKVMAVVKANAYGHGALEVAGVALANGADRLAIATLGEGIALRKAGFGVPILILGPTPPEDVGEAVRYNLTQTVFSYELAEAMSWAAVQQRKTAKVHIKLDTGMGRIGLDSNDKDTVDRILAISKLPNLEVEGIFTHFAVSDITDKSFAREQFTRFLGVTEELEKRGLPIPVRHVANSAAIIDLPETHLDMVRAGIILYGLYPSDEVNKSRIDLRPAMSLKAKVSHVKEVPPGTSISYGRTYQSSGPEIIATLPLGYADGYSRLLSNKGEVLIHGKRAPVVGRVCMDQIMVNVTHIPGVRVGDEAVLFGEQQGVHLSVDELAEKIGTINY
ncbi:MAG TPA: alanine racemase, partial [Bacillota bacterium]|nr:alanine racemase [Bacillota bacterium]